MHRFLAGVLGVLVSACLRVPEGDIATGTGSQDESSSSMGGSEATTMVVEGSCRDGVQDEGEACDDGNGVDEDACPSGAVGTCRAARCGSRGVLGVTTRAQAAVGLHV